MVGPPLDGNLKFHGGKVDGAFVRCGPVPPVILHFSGGIVEECCAQGVRGF